MQKLILPFLISLPRHECLSLPAAVDLLDQINSYIAVLIKREIALRQITNDPK